MRQGHHFADKPDHGEMPKQLAEQVALRYHEKDATLQLLKVYPKSVKVKCDGQCACKTTPFMMECGRYLRYVSVTCRLRTLRGERGVGGWSMPLTARNWHRCNRRFSPTPPADRSTVRLPVGYR